jgi:hypothetical protein
MKKTKGLRFPAVFRQPGVSSSGAKAMLMHGASGWYWSAIIHFLAVEGIRARVAITV